MGETDVTRVIVPVKPLRGATVTVDVAPTIAVKEVGLAETAKSTGLGVTTAVTVAEVVIAPALPMIVTV